MNAPRFIRRKAEELPEAVKDLRNVSETENSICMLCFATVIPKPGESLDHAEWSHRCDSTVLDEFD